MKTEDHSLSAFFVKEDGLIYVNRVPEEPHHFSSDYLELRKAQQDYEAALASAKESAIKCADQEQATERLIKSGVCVSMEINKPLIAPGVYPIEGLTWEVKEELYMDNAFRSRKVAILKESAPSTEKEKPKGLYGKYIIHKSNGKPIDPEAEFFVLRLDPLGEMNHVKACRKAVQVYANEIEPFIPELANDLRERYPIESTEKEESQEEPIKKKGIYQLAAEMQAKDRVSITAKELQDFIQKRKAKDQ